MARLLALFLLALLFLAPIRAPAEIVRIAVAEGIADLAVQAEGLRARPLTEDGYYAPVETGSTRLGLRGGAVTLSGKPLAQAIKLRADGPITLGAKQVRGAVEVRAQGAGLLVVNELAMETYLAAVLGSEMPPAFEAEALKAQAVAARTYAVGKKIAAQGQSYHLGATVLAQVYGGVHREDPRTRDAVRATEGEVLVFDHTPAEAYFFSSCGGHTEDGAEALGRPLPYLRGTTCPEASATPGASWKLRLGAKELGRRLGLPAVHSIEIATRTRTGRARTLLVKSAKGSRRFTAVELRRLLGYGELKSLAFEVDRSGGHFHFSGRGSGHGAGMCQWGAQAAAKEGWSYREILRHYYPGAEIRRMY